MGIQRGRRCLPLLFYDRFATKIRLLVGSQEERMASGLIQSHSKRAFPRPSVMFPGQTKQLFVWFVAVDYFFRMWLFACLRGIGNERRGWDCRDRLVPTMLRKRQFRCMRTWSTVWLLPEPGTSRMPTTFFKKFFCDTFASAPDFKTKNIKRHGFCA